MSNLQKPQRRYVLKLELGADDPTDFFNSLKEITDLLKGGCAKSLHAGYSAGYHFEVTEQKTMTHDRYMAELEKYLDALRQEEVGQ